jgi:hypothetical protein
MPGKGAGKNNLAFFQALIERPYSRVPQPVGAVYDRPAEFRTLVVRLCAAMAQNVPRMRIGN